MSSATLELETHAVLLYCRECRFIGKAVINDRREAVLKMTMGFIAAKPGSLGLQFRCAKCGSVVAESAH